MKHCVSSIACFLLCVSGFAQLDSADRGIRQLINGAKATLTSVLGKELVQKHFRVDYEYSHELSRKTFPGTYEKRTTGIDGTIFQIEFGVVQDSNVIGWVSLLVDSAGAPVSKGSLYGEKGIPQTLFAFKRMLTNGFAIDYKKASAIGKAKGFEDGPFLQVETDFDATSVNGNTYVKLKFMWCFFDMNEKGSAQLRINAETGKIEKEEYSPRMPK